MSYPWRKRTMQLQRATKAFRDAMLPFIDPIVGKRALLLDAVNDALKETGFRLVDTVEFPEPSPPEGGAR